MIDLEAVREKLMEVYDPELGVNVVDLGLIYGIEEPEEGLLAIRMTMTTPGCPAHDTLSMAVESAAALIPGVERVNVDVVWDPPWTPHMMSEDAKRMLWYFRD